MRRSLPALASLLLLLGCMPPARDPRAADGSSSPRSIRTFVPDDAVKKVLPQVRSLIQARNDQRRKDVRDLAQALSLYRIETGGVPLAAGDTKRICKEGRGDCGEMIRLDALVPGHIAVVPSDPLADENGGDTGYVVSLRSDGTITVTAPRAEEGETIAASQR